MTSHGHSHGHGQSSCNGHGHSDVEQQLLESKSGHGHSHGHSHKSNAKDQERLKTAVYFALFFMLLEIVGGVVSNSLAVITDAAHMLSDIGGFIVSLFSLHLSALPASQQYTFGFKQAEVLGALLSVAIVWALTAILFWEAVPRFITPSEIDGKVMFVISLAGLVVNIGLMNVLGHGHSHHDPDDHSECGHESGVAIQAALAHVIGDIVQSLGVCLASLCIWLHPFDIGVTQTPIGPVSNWNYADPLCTVLFGLIVLHTTKATFLRTINILMGKAPHKVNQTKLVESLQSIPDVTSVHDIHIWSIGSADIYLTAHLVVINNQPGNTTLEAAMKIARAAGIHHFTFQLEVEMDRALDCGACDSREVGLQRSEEQGDGHGHGHGHSCNGHGHAH